MSTQRSTEQRTVVSVGIVRAAQRFNVRHDTSDDELVVVAREHVKNIMRHAQRHATGHVLLRDRDRQRSAVKDAYTQLLAHRDALVMQEENRQALSERTQIMHDCGAQSARAQHYLSLRAIERARFREWWITIVVLIVAVVAMIVALSAKYAPVGVFGGSSSKDVEIAVYSPTGGIEEVDMARAPRTGEIPEDAAQIVEVRDYHQFSIYVDDVDRSERVIVDVAGTGIVGCRVTIDNVVISDKAEPSEVSCQATW